MAKAKTKAEVAGSDERSMLNTAGPQKPEAEMPSAEDPPTNYDPATKTNPKPEELGAVAPLDRDLPKRK